MRRQNKRRKLDIYYIITSGAITKPSLNNKGKYLTHYKNLIFIFDTGLSR